MLEFNITFFKNIKKPKEILVIYAILIFKYQYIFLHYDNVIERTILKKSVNQTINIVKQKTLKNSILFEYIWLDFFKNLNINNNKEDNFKNTGSPNNNNEIKEQENSDNEYEVEEELNKIKEKENENSTSIDNNNSSLNGTKETNISNLTINEQNGDSNLRK